jgi:RHS repeat-associated protein
LPAAIGVNDADYMHARFYNPLVGRFLSVDPVMQTAKASLAPQFWNRYSYALNNPMLMVDPTGEDVSIGINFVSEGEDVWTDANKALLLGLVRQFWQGLNVGAVYVFDAAKYKHGKSGTGVATITVDSDAIGTSSPTRVRAGDLFGDASLTRAQRFQGVANRVSHEVFTHQFGLVPFRVAFNDPINFSRQLNPSLITSDIRSRYGTIADSQAFNGARAAAIGGPLPVYSPDLERAQFRLSPVRLDPPVPRGPWWKFW